MKKTNTETSRERFEKLFQGFIDSGINANVLWDHIKEERKKAQIEVLQGLISNELNVKNNDYPYIFRDKIEKLTQQLNK